MITIRHNGNFNKIEKFFSQDRVHMRIFESYGRKGVEALSSTSPIDTGETAKSWDYIINKSANSVTISWINSNIVGGVAVAILLQYGHGTRNGGYVQGRDYINPAMRSIFDKMISDIWKEITK